MSTASALKEQLVQLISKNFAEGILDGQYELLQTLKADDSPDFIVEVLSTFCKDHDKLVGEMDKFTKPVFDFDGLKEYVYQLSGSSACVGSKQIQIVGDELIEAASNKDEAKCKKALLKIKHEFDRVINVFQHIIQLEQKILACSRSKQA